MYYVFMHTHKHHTHPASRPIHMEPCPQNTTLTAAVCICVSVKFRSHYMHQGHCFAVTSRVLSRTNRNIAACASMNTHHAVLKHDHDATI
jgi:hypothetical protein